MCLKAKRKQKDVSAFNPDEHQIKLAFHFKECQIHSENM